MSQDEFEVVNEWYPEDKKLIAFIRTLRYGSITIKLKDGKPVLIERGIKTILLTGKE